jgi:hypothetical protein
VGRPTRAVGLGRTDADGLGQLATVDLIQQVLHGLARNGTTVGVRPHSHAQRDGCAGLGDHVGCVHQNGLFFLAVSGEQHHGCDDQRRDVRALHFSFLERTDRVL